MKGKLGATRGRCIHRKTGSQTSFRIILLGGKYRVQIDHVINYLQVVLHEQNPLIKYEYIVY